MHMRSLDWDDLRILLAIAETGSLNAAATRLAVNHTTVLRRLGAIEKRLGTALFERSPSGQALTPAVEGALPALLRMAEAALEAERRFLGAVTALSGTLRVTTTDTVAVTLAGDLIGAFRHLHPDVAIELTTSNAFANLTRREADVAIRPASGVPETLVGRRVGAIAFAVYASAGCQNPDALAWIGLDDSLASSAIARWLAANVPAGFAARCDSLVAARELSAAGIGRAVLPRYLGDADPRLQPIAQLDITGELWILTHADLARSARVRAFTAFAFDHLKGKVTEAR
jgi:DNA-binding transcriptional LysR family regulator